MDLEYKATQKPVWIFKNMGQNTTTSKYGYYFVTNCEVNGNIILNDKKYKVKGVGYHDHTWSPLFKKKNSLYEKKSKRYSEVALVYDWLYFHFKNDWNVFIGKLHLSKRNLFSLFIPGTFNLVSNDCKLMDSYFVPIKYKNFKKTSIPDLKFPYEITIKSIKLNPFNKYPIKGPLFLELTYKTENLKESLYGKPPFWGMWYSSGKVFGKLKGVRKEIDLEGFGILEYTRNI
jgi:hypothetical protein